MRDFDFIVSGAGGTFRLNAEGRYFRYMSGSAGGASPAIVVRGLDSGAALRVLPGQSFTLPASERAWLLTNPGAASIAGFVLVGDGNFGDQTVAGVVEVVDGGRARSIAGGGFGANVYQGAGGAALFSRLQLWNPAGSGRRVMVERFTPFSGAASTAGHLRFANAALVTLEMVGQSKLAGGAVSVMEARKDTTATVSAGAMVYGTSVAASQSAPIPSSGSPLVIRPGWGLLYHGTIANVDMGANFEWYEEADV